MAIWQASNQLKQEDLKKKINVNPEKNPKKILENSEKKFQTIFKNFLDWKKIFKK